MHNDKLPLPGSRLPRGVYKFNKLIVETFEEKQPISTPHIKGRSKELLDLRDRLLLTRFWFYSTYSKMRYDLIISMLVNEFFLSERRITDIIGADTLILKELRIKRPKIKELVNTYPYLVWNLSKLNNF